MMKPQWPLNKIWSQCRITSECSSHCSALVCWISVNKDVLHKLNWLFELQLRSSHKMWKMTCMKEKVDRKMEKMMTVQWWHLLGWIELSDRFRQKTRKIGSSFGDNGFETSWAESWSNLPPVNPSVRKVSPEIMKAADSPKNSQRLRS